MIPPEISSQHCPILQFYLAGVESGRMVTNADQTSTGKTQWQPSSPRLDGWGIHMSIHGGWVWNIWVGIALLCYEERHLEDRY